MIQYYRGIGEVTTAENLDFVLSSGGSDASLGLSFTRVYEDGKIGFAGAFKASDGSKIPVRVLFGLPDRLWPETVQAPLPPEVDAKGCGGGTKINYKLNLI